MAPRARLAVFVLLAPLAASAQLVDVVGVPQTTYWSLGARGDTLFAAAGTRVHYSPDRGETWQAAYPVAAAVEYIDAIVATDAGWFAGTPVGVYRTIDRGVTWSPLNAGLIGIGAHTITDLQVRGTQLYAATDGAGVFELDLAQPVAWQQFGDEFAQNVAETVAALALHRGRLVAGAGGNGLVFVSAPSGPHWAVHQLPHQIHDVVDTGSAVVACSGRSAFLSVDDGQTWEATGPVGVSGFMGVLAASQTSVFLAIQLGENVSRLFRSEDLAAAWQPVADVSGVLGMLVYDDRLYLAQEDGLRYMPIQSTGTGQDASVLSGLDLDPPFPNPTGHVVRIPYRLERPAFVLLEILDPAGRVVARPVDGWLPAGDGIATWEAAGVTNGTYLVRLASPLGTATAVLTIVR